MLSSRAAVSLFLVLAAGSAHSVRATQPGEVGIAGNEAILWAFQRRPDAEGNELLRFAYRRVRAGKSSRFRRLPMDPVTGRVVHAVVVGLDLRVFFGDGTHRRYMPPRRSMRSAAPPRVQRSEVTLPDSALPFALAADASRGVLYALVTGRQAARIDSLERGRRGPADDTAPEETTGTLLVTPPGPSDADCALVRYESGRWLRDRDAPPDLTLDTGVLALLAENGAIHVIYRGSAQDTTYVHRISPKLDAAWSDPDPVPVNGQPTHHASGWIGGEPVLLVGRRVEEGIMVRSVRRRDEAWSNGAVLTDDNGRPIAFQPPLSVSTFDSEVAVITLDESGDAQVGSWVLDTGVPLKPFKRVTSLTPLHRPATHSSAWTLVQYAILVCVLTAVFAWRRNAILTPVLLKPGQAPAPLLRRGAALFIDTLILAPVWSLALFYRVQHAAGDLSPAEQLMFVSRTIAPDSLWLTILGAIVGLYAAILEAMTGTTPGKRLAGLHVVAHGGDRCRLSQILARNAARVIEFPLAPLVLLVALTPSRQRLGDIFARTVVVVEWVDTSSPESPSDSDSNANGTHRHL